MHSSAPNIFMCLSSFLKIFASIYICIRTVLPNSTTVGICFQYIYSVKQT